jgi:aminotransferase
LGNHQIGLTLNKPLQIAERLKKVRPSDIRRLFSLTQGIPNIISLGIGEPDFSPPFHVLRAAKRALDEGKTHYTPTMGIPELREALAKIAKNDYSLTYNPENEILVTNGGTEGIFLALLSIINPKDEVLIQDPGFVCYEPDVLMADGTPVPVPLSERSGFRYNFETVISRITDRSRMIIVNTPSNPVGNVLSYDETASIAKIAVERDLIVICDEVYEKIVYDGAKHYSLATFPGMRERTIVVNSFSKTYAMTGFRIGYVLGPKEIITQMSLALQYTVACVNGPAQYAALAALEGSQDSVKEMIKEFDRRRRLMYSGLIGIKGFRCTLPQGAFYIFPNIQDFGKPSNEFTEYLLKEGSVVAVPGSAFGKHGEGYVRFSYATSYSKIEEALNRIEKAVKKLRHLP